MAALRSDAIKLFFSLLISQSAVGMLYRAMGMSIARTPLDNLFKPDHLVDVAFSAVMPACDVKCFRKRRHLFVS